MLNPCITCINKRFLHMIGNDKHDSVTFRTSEEDSWFSFIFSLMFLETISTFATMSSPKGNYGSLEIERMQKHCVVK